MPITALSTVKADDGGVEGVRRGEPLDYHQRGLDMARVSPRPADSAPCPRYPRDR